MLHFHNKNVSYVKNLTILQLNKYTAKYKTEHFYLIIHLYIFYIIPAFWMIGSWNNSLFSHLGSCGDSYDQYWVSNLQDLLHTGHPPLGFISWESPPVALGTEEAFWM